MKDPLGDTFGIRVQKAMDAAKRSNGEVAAAMSTHLKTISKWRKNRQIPDDDAVFIKLADYLGVTPGWLRYGNAAVLISDSERAAEAMGRAAQAIADIGQWRGPTPEHFVGAVKEGGARWARDLPTSVFGKVYEYLLIMANAGCTRDQVEWAKRLLTETQLSPEAQPSEAELLAAIDSMWGFIRNEIRRQGTELAATLNVADLPTESGEVVQLHPPLGHPPIVKKPKTLKIRRPKP